MERSLEKLLCEPWIVVVSPDNLRAPAWLPAQLVEAGLRARLAIVVERPSYAVACARASASYSDLPAEAQTSPKDRLSAEARLCYFTHRSFLEELARDPQLRAYRLIIFDAPHAHTIEGPLVLAMLRKIALRRPDLRIVLRTDRTNAPRFCEEHRAQSIELSPPKAENDDSESLLASSSGGPPAELTTELTTAPLLDPLSSARPLDDSITRELFSAETSSFASAARLVNSSENSPETDGDDASASEPDTCEAHDHNTLQSNSSSIHQLLRSESSSADPNSQELPFRSDPADQRQNTRATVLHDPLAQSARRLSDEIHHELFAPTREADDSNLDLKQASDIPIASEDSTLDGFRNPLSQDLRPLSEDIQRELFGLAKEDGSDLKDSNLPSRSAHSSSAVSDSDSPALEDELERTDPAPGPTPRELYDPLSTSSKRLSDELHREIFGCAPHEEDLAKDLGADTGEHQSNQEELEGRRPEWTDPEQSTQAPAPDELIKAFHNPLAATARRLSDEQAKVILSESLSESQEEGAAAAEETDSADRRRSLNSASSLAGAGDNARASPLELAETPAESSNKDSPLSSERFLAETLEAIPGAIGAALIDHEGHRLIAYQASFRLPVLARDSLSGACREVLRASERLDSHDDAAPKVETRQASDSGRGIFLRVNEHKALIVSRDHCSEALLLLLIDDEDGLQRTLSLAQARLAAWLARTPSSEGSV